MDPALPIGVFDSGIGGLTVLKDLAARLPNENFIYLGDVARLPYGTKSAHVVIRYAQTCVQFLVNRRVKYVVIACNTATAMAISEVSHMVSVAVTGVIEPGVKAALSATKNGRVLVLATQSTVKSEAYLREFERHGYGTHVEQIACPLLVPLAEEGWFNHETTAHVIQSYLSKVQYKEFDTVLLGCTHYPLLEESFRRVLPQSIALVHGGPHLAQTVAQKLTEERLQNSSDSHFSHRFFSTDTISSSLPIIRALFDHPVDFELVDLERQ
ncbi:MAG: glutamate racemase [Deltaproteobacteria bacterium]|nr:glutamate racemase [Deltaproteobacteria bacterium]